MNGVTVTMRVDVAPPFGERRDALDQRWHTFLAACELRALPAPNHAATAQALLAASAGLVLSGGNDLGRFGGDAPERDATEAVLLDAALAAGLPILGVCRGMQVLAERFGCALDRVEAHAGAQHVVRFAAGGERRVNSYHQYGVTVLDRALAAIATAADGSIEAFRHPDLPIYGVMWHPEREATPHVDDVALFRTLFGTG